MAKQKSGIKAARVSLQRTVDSLLIHDIKNLAFRLSALLQNVDEHFENPVFRTNLIETLGDTILRMNTMVQSFHNHQQQVILKLKVNLNDILTTLITELPKGSIRHIRIETELTEIPPIWGDSFYLQEALKNLVHNAIEAMPEGGVLRLQTRVVTARKTSRVAVEISDTGVGMSRSFIESQLFQPFASTKKNGMGLGLYTARQVFQLHGGKIQVKSTPSVGSIFLIQFPAVKNVT